MKLFFEDYGKLNLRSEVYNALSDIAFKYYSKDFSSDEIKAAFDEALEWFNIRFWDIEDFDESLNEGKDLSQVDGTITKVIQDNSKELSAINNREELMNRVIQLFKENNIDTKKSREMIRIMQMKKSLISLQNYIWNVFLKGTDNGVIR